MRQTVELNPGDEVEIIVKRDKTKQKLIEVRYDHIFLSTVGNLHLKHVKNWHDSNAFRWDKD